jgi:hypothetical protein
MEAQEAGMTLLIRPRRNPARDRATAAKIE